MNDVFFNNISQVFFREIKKERETTKTITKSPTIHGVSFVLEH